MATSGTTAFNLDLTELVEEAFESVRDSGRMGKVVWRGRAHGHCGGKGEDFPQDKYAASGCRPDTDSDRSHKRRRIDPKHKEGKLEVELVIAG